MCVRLRHAIQEVPLEFQLYKLMFQNVFGPVICNGREMQMLETVQAIRKAAKLDGYQNRSPARRQNASIAARELLSDDQ